MFLEYRGVYGPFFFDLLFYFSSLLVLVWHPLEAISIKLCYLIKNMYTYRICLSTQIFEDLPRSDTTLFPNFLYEDPKGCPNCQVPIINPMGSTKIIANLICNQGWTTYLSFKIFLIIVQDVSRESHNYVPTLPIECLVDYKLAALRWWLYSNPSESWTQQ